jgi:hypothetical protein
VLNRMFRHVSVLWRAEGTIAEARLQIAMRRYVLYALAGLIAVFGLGMLNLAAFFAAQALSGPIWAAIAAALGDFILALIVAGIGALSARPSAHLNTALDMRQAALEGIDAEFIAMQEPFAWLSRAARNPIDTALPAALVPVITAIVRGLRKDKAESK